MPLPPIPGDAFLSFQADQWRRQKEAELEQLAAAGWAVRSQNLVGHLGNAFSDLGGAAREIQQRGAPTLPTLASDLGSGIGQTFSALGTGIQQEEVQPAQAFGAAALAQGGASLQAARDYPQTNVAPVVEDWAQRAQSLIDRIGQTAPQPPPPAPDATGGLPAAPLGALRETPPGPGAPSPDLPSFLQQSTLAPGAGAENPNQPSGTSLPATPPALGGLGAAHAAHAAQDALGALAGNVRQGAQGLGQGVGQALSGNLSSVVPDYTPPDLRAVTDVLAGVPAVTPGGLGAGLGAALATGLPTRTTALAGPLGAAVGTNVLAPGLAAMDATRAGRTQDYDDFLARLTAGTPGQLTPERRAQLAADAARYDETMQNVAGGLSLRGPAEAGVAALAARGAAGAAREAGAAESAAARVPLSARGNAVDSAAERVASRALRQRQLEALQRQAGLLPDAAAPAGAAAASREALVARNVAAGMPPEVAAQQVDAYLARTVAEARPPVGPPAPSAATREAMIARNVAAGLPAEQAAQQVDAVLAATPLPGARAVTPSVPQGARAPLPDRQALIAKNVAAGMPTAQATQQADQFLATQQLRAAVEEHVSLPSQVISLLTRNLLGLPTVLGNAGGNALLLARRPVTEALGLRIPDAVADVRAMAGAVVDAAGAFRDAWGGRSGLQNAIDWVGPTLTGTDNFYRTLNGAGARAVAARRGYAAPQAEKFVTGAVDQALLSSRGTLLGKLLTDARQAMHASDPLDRAMGYASWAATPFTRVPDAILRQAAEIGISPVLEPYRFIRAIGARDGPAAQDAAGRLLLNGPIAYVATVKALDNGLVTGMGPKDPKRLAQLRAARDEQGRPVWQPRSVKVGGNWVPYGNYFGPYAPLVEAIATAYERGQEQDAKPDTGLQQKVDAWIRSGVAGFTDATYLEGLLRVAKGVADDPAKQGLRSTGDVLSRAVPATVGAVARATDPYQRETDQGRPWETLQAKVPGLRERLPVQISPTTGEAVKAPAPTLASILLNASGTTPADPVANEVNRLAGAGAGVTVPTVDRTLDYAGVRQTPQARQAYQAALGKEVNREVSALLDTPGYQQASDTQKAQALKDAFGRARTWAGVAVGAAVKRDPKHQADYEFLAVPQYEGVSSRQTPEQIRTENLRIAQARSLLADYRAKYPATPARGEAELAKSDPKTFNLAKRGKLPADFLRTRKEAVAKRVGVSPDDDPGLAVLSAGAAR